MPNAAEELTWQDDAKCQGVADGDKKFFPEKNEYGQVSEGKALCKECPVRKECLSYALKYNVAGIWGGTTERDRRRIRSMTGLIPIAVQLN